jgi:hypothetical protein
MPLVASIMRIRTMATEGGGSVGKRHPTTRWLPEGTLHPHLPGRLYLSAGGRAESGGFTCIVGFRTGMHARTWQNVQHPRITYSGRRCGTHAERG